MKSTKLLPHKPTLIRQNNVLPPKDLGSTIHPDTIHLNRLNHFRARSERSASKPNTKTSKLTPNDNSRHVQLINLEP